MQSLKPLPSGMTCLKRFTKDAALFEQATRSSNLATSPSLNWHVCIFTGGPTGADQAFTCGQVGCIVLLVSPLRLLAKILRWNLTSILACSLKDLLNAMAALDEDNIGED